MLEKEFPISRKPVGPSYTVRINFDYRLDRPDNVDIGELIARRRWCFSDVDRPHSRNVTEHRIGSIPGADTDRRSIGRSRGQFRVRFAASVQTGSRLQLVDTLSAGIHANDKGTRKSSHPSDFSIDVSSRLRRRYEDLRSRST